MRPHPVVSSCAPRSRISNALAPVLVASYGCDHLDAQISRRPHQSLPLEVGFALLEEGLDALTGVLCLRDQQELAVQVMQRGAKVHVLLSVQRGSAQSH